MASDRGPESTQRDRIGDDDTPMKMYVKFGAMILTAMVVMYAVMFAGSWEWSDIRFSESRVFMALAMGGTMGLIMLAWMLNMYRKTSANLIVIAVSLVLLATGVTLDRTQANVNDVDFMQGMIPHHSLAITRSERFDSADIRVCELAVAISEAQRREILEMDWLINDIRENGAAVTAEAAAERSLPDFSRPALRDCPPPPN